jgi:hypothetical protein
MICVLKAVIGWVVLMLVGTNLIGMVVRGLMNPAARLQPDLDPFVQGEVARYRRANTVVTGIFTLLTLAYLYALLRFFNVAVALAAFMLITGRIPDLLFEIRTGQPVNNMRIMPKTPIHVLATVMDWAALPVLWWGLCRFRR